MKIIAILIFFLCILFFVIFIYVLFKNNNKLIKIRVIKDPIEDEQKYISIMKNNLFKKEKCDEYHSKKIKYDLCKECNKENRCYDPIEGTCTGCTNNYTCEQLYGI